MLLGLFMTPGSLRCVRENSYACVYTHGLGTPTASQYNICDLEKLSQIVSCAAGAGGVRTSGLWVSSPTLYQLSHPVITLRKYVASSYVLSAKPQTGRQIGGWVGLPGEDFVTSFRFVKVGTCHSL